MINQSDVLKLREFTTHPSFASIKEAWEDAKPVLPIRKQDIGMSDKQIDIIVGIRDGWDQAIKYFIGLRENDILPEQVEETMEMNDDDFENEDHYPKRKRRKKGEL